MPAMKVTILAEVTSLAASIVTTTARGSGVNRLPLAKVSFDKQCKVKPNILFAILGKLFLWVLKKERAIFL